MSRNVPYTTKSGLQIGIYYQPPRQIEVISRDMERLQDTYLYAPRASLFDKFRRFFRMVLAH